MHHHDPFFPLWISAVLPFAVLYVGSRNELARMVKVARRFRWFVRYERVGTGRVLVARDGEGLRSVCYGMRSILGKRKAGA